MAKVLVVDDSLSVRKVVERALAGRRIQVVEAASGSVALELLEREAPELVVCDVIMPDRDGCEICAFVKTHPRLAGTPVLLMSGIVDDDVRQRAARAGADDVLLKPFAVDDLLGRLERLLPALAAPVPETLTSDVPTPEVAVVLPVPEPVLAPPAPAPEPAARAASPEIPAAPAPPAELGALLARFTAMDGVQWAVIADADGLVLEATEEWANEAGIGAALGACLAEASQGLSRELGRGALTSLIVEFEKGTVILWRVGAGALLAVGLTGPAALGKVRYYAKKVLAEVSQAM